MQRVEKHRYTVHPVQVVVKFLGGVVGRNTVEEFNSPIGVFTELGVPIDFSSALLTLPGAKIGVRVTFILVSISISTWMRVVLISACPSQKLIILSSFPARGRCMAVV